MYGMTHYVLLAERIHLGHRLCKFYAQLEDIISSVLDGKSLKDENGRLSRMNTLVATLGRLR
jgi:hypothetical protein